MKFNFTYITEEKTFYVESSSINADTIDAAFKKFYKSHTDGCSVLSVRTTIYSKDGCFDVIVLKRDESVEK